VHHREPLDSCPHGVQVTVHDVGPPGTLERHQAQEDENVIDERKAVPDELVAQLERRVCHDAATPRRSGPLHQEIDAGLDAQVGTDVRYEVRRNGSDAEAFQLSDDGSSAGSRLPHDGRELHMADESVHRARGRFVKIVPAIPESMMGSALFHSPPPRR
jgi:hypothetical protein